MLTAITRKVSPKLAQCELSFKDREPIDPALAAMQHSAYEARLEQLGVRVISLPALAEYPDCVFVEDGALVLDEVAVITRPGVSSRVGEVESLAHEVARHRDILTLEAPATLEGGDVMRAGKTLYVGLTRRTNVAGIQQLARLLEPFGYWITPVEVHDCLHLKSACSYVGDETILANRAWLDDAAFCGLKVLDVPPAEPHGANALRVGGNVLLPASCPRTAALMEASGFRVTTVDTSELIKAEGGVTCMSLLFETR
jgi:dimethylargininase